jgi:hypothetical protein
MFAHGVIEKDELERVNDRLRCFLISDISKIVMTYIGWLVSSFFFFFFFFS